MTKVNVSRHIKSIEPYEGGLPIEEVARELNIPEQDIVKLASNENPLGISPLAKKAIERSLIDIERYPDGNGFYLKKAISKKYKLQSSEIILGNGSNDVLELVARTFLSENDEALSEDLIRKMLGLSDQGRIIDLFEYISNGNVESALTEIRDQVDIGVDPSNLIEVLNLLHPIKNNCIYINWLII